ncbi:uncharacterized protein F5891DRAFT_984837 [Suillus fuscotomentosus]|uniref:Uncharacterized protein n=1 Tax=Suillus fuscotomentosus TaxID=1912939 RepID=A0AAD4DW24_9AGAM|nr:uncharacterized protein F5891DRAFT_984837 [Suillus fuscotomentosus]KAG1894677.1 hypothetical protein F5891DRAFT_984837 [Suillus fuscotomentosus]
MAVPDSYSQAFLAAFKQSAKLLFRDPIAVKRVKSGQQFCLLLAIPLEFNRKLSSYLFEGTGRWLETIAGSAYQFSLYYDLQSILLALISHQGYTAASTYAPLPPPSAQRQHGYLNSYPFRGAVMIEEGEDGASIDKSVRQKCHYHYLEPRLAWPVFPAVIVSARPEVLGCVNIAL